MNTASTLPDFLPASQRTAICEVIESLAFLPISDPELPWTVREMAKYCNLSVSRFRQLFVHCTGTSPQKYLRKVRLSLARSLLVTEPLLTVEEVADRVGISDAHSFHAIYKKQFGETPKQRLTL